jgi:hypothetical protein
MQENAVSKMQENGSGTTRKPVALALQGGGSWGAYTWGVLDALLASRTIGIEKLSGTSAGAINAAIVASALASRGVIGYWDFTDGPVWIPPHGRVQAPRDAEAFGAPEDTLARAFDHLARLRADVPSGSFVFVISDFLAPPPEECWRRAQARRWDVVPVIVQDALWEQSFPELHGVVIPVADPRTGAVAPVRLTAREARARREANEARLARLLEFFRALRIDPVVLATSDPYAIDGEFLAWAARRRLLRGRGR